VRFAEVNLFGVGAFFNARRPTVALRAVGPALLFGLRLWASVCLALCAAFRLELDNTRWAGTTAAIICQPHLGASLRKGWFRMVGAVAIVVMTACFPQDRAAFFVSLALWGAGMRARRHASAQFLGLYRGLGRLHCGDHRERPTRCRRGSERASLHARRLPHKRDLHR